MGLENIFSRSYPGANLFEVSLVKDTDPELPFYKNRYFCFISLVPGTQGQDGNRGFNKEGKITLKTEIEKLSALAHSIRMWARGQGKAYGNFSIWVDPSKSSHGGGGGAKTCFISEFIPKNKQSGVEEPNRRQISVSFKQGTNNPVGVFYSPSEALAIADQIEFIAQKGLEMEFEARTLQIGKVPPQRNGGKTPPPAGRPANVPPAESMGQALGEAMNSMSPPPFDDDSPFH